MNPDSQNYSKMGLTYCQKVIFKELPKNLIDHPESVEIKEEKGKKEEEKKEEGGCILFWYELILLSLNQTWEMSYRQYNQDLM